MGRKYNLVLILGILLLVSCGIESFEPEYRLNPPLGLTAETVSNGIKLTFWGLNPEDYFSGYQVFVGTSYDEVRTNDRSKRVPNNSGDFPTIIVTPFNTSTKFEIVITYTTNLNEPLVSGLEYYFSVAAYSKRYDIFSPLSNITNAKAP